MHNPIGFKLMFYETGPAEVTAHFTPSSDYEGFPGVLHGGMVATLLDEVGGRVTMIGDHAHFMMTAKMEVKYRQPTPVGQPLRIVGRLLNRRGRLATAHAAIWLPDDTITAEAHLTLADLPDSFQVPTNLEEFGWKVY